MNIATLFLPIPTLGAGDVELEVDYSVRRADRAGTGADIEIDSCSAVIPTGDGKHTTIQCWHHLTQAQRAQVEERCREDYYERMEG